MNSKYLYLALNLLALSVPLAASFRKSVPFYKKWKYLFPSITITAIVFIVWDELFTRFGIWGFNKDYVTGIYLGSLPIEEVLFFFCIPYACVFTYFALNHLIEKDWLFPHQEIISSALIVTLLLLGIHNIDLAYPGATFIALGALLTYLLLVVRGRYMGRFYSAFLFIMIPFFLVNGLLTGAFTESEVVWYNNAETLGTRIGTIPVEDIFYAMLMLLMNISLFEYFQYSPIFRPKPKKKVTGAFQ